MGQLPAGQEVDRAAGLLLWLDGMRPGGIRRLGEGLALGSLAGLQRNGVRGQGAGSVGRGESGDDVFVFHVASQQQHLDQGFGAGRLAVGGAGRGPPGFVDGGELPCSFGLFEGGRSGEGARLAQECFQVVVQDQAGFAPAPLRRSWWATTVRPS
ncbi:hypothetical protein ACWEQ1_34050 [Streptomyces nodosus]